ncbi:unnamed protein product [Diamesa serratosioi]
MLLVEYSAPSYPTFFQWNKRWGIEQPGLTQSAPITPVASAPAPIAYNWNKQVTFNQPPPIQYTEPAPISYSRQAPALNWNFNKFWGVNPAPPVAHQTTAQFEIKPVTFTIPSIQIPVPIINWNFNKNWGTNQPSNSQGIQSKTNVEEQKEVPIQNPQPTVETFEKTVEAPNNHSPVVASKRVDFKLSVG